MSKNLSLPQLCAFCVFLVVALAVVLNPTVAFAQSADEDLEREAQAIDKMIMCPVCPAETIDQAQVEISFQMRAVIREMLAEGRTRDEVLDYFVDRYGADILAAPPKSGANLVAWILPIAGVLAGIAVLFLVIRSMIGRKVAEPSVTSSDSVAGAPGGREAAVGTGAETMARQGLAPYLEIVDRNLGARRRMASPADGPRTSPSSSAAETNGRQEPGSDG